MTCYPGRLQYPQSSRCSRELLWDKCRTYSRNTIHHSTSNGNGLAVNHTLHFERTRSRQATTAKAVNDGAHSLRPPTSRLYKIAKSMLRRINDVLQFLRRVGVLEGFVKYRITQALAGYALGDPGHAGGPLTPSEEASHLGKLADWDEADGQHGAARDAVVVAVSEVVDAEELIDDVIEPVGRGLAHEPGAGDRVAVIQATQEGVEQEHVWPVFDQLERPAVQDLGGLVLGERLVRARAPAAGRTFGDAVLCRTVAARRASYWRSAGKLFAGSAV